MKNSFSHPDWSKKSNIYEVNIRQYTKEGTFKAFLPHIDRLHNMGVDILWIMPISPIGKLNRKGTLGSYYAISDYTAINPEFGTMDDFKEVVEKVHSLGMHIIIDWVANHTAWDHSWVHSNPEWYQKDADGVIKSPFDWTDALALNYENKDLWKAMTDSMKFWVEETDIDGFRCDVAMLVPVEFWNEARKELDKLKPIFMLAEAEEVNHHEKAFDASYTWELFKIMQKVSKRENNVEQIFEEIEKEKQLFPKSAYRMLFTSNHDENSWNGTEFELFGDAARTFSVLTFVMPGIPLIYNGQEAGLSHRLEFFEKDEIDWTHLYSEDYYKYIINIRNTNPALWNGVEGGDLIRLNNNNTSKIFSFARKKGDNTVLVLCNLSPDGVDASINFALFEGIYTNSFTKEEIIITTTTKFYFAPWQYYIIERY
jgi:glycosidase